MTDIATWLGQQLDEDVRGASVATQGPWTLRDPQPGGDGFEVVADQSPAHRPNTIQRWVVGGENGGGVYDRQDAEHIARHDPASVLRDVAAKRRILARHWDGHGCPVCLIEMGADEDGAGNAHEYPVLHWIGPCETVRDLAEPYDERPGYKDEWRVS